MYPFENTSAKRKKGKQMFTFFYAMIQYVIQGCAVVGLKMNIQRQLFEQTTKQMNDDLIRPKRVRRSYEKIVEYFL